MCPSSSVCLWTGLLVPSLLLACGSPPPGGHDGGRRDAGRLDPDGGEERDAGTRVRPSAEPQHWFDDVTIRAGVTVERPDDFDSLPRRMGGGVCVLDVDGQPPMDLFFALGPNESGGSVLYASREPLVFRDRTAELGLDSIGPAMGCLAFDADGDSDDDLLVTGIGSVRLFIQEAAGFVERSERLAVPRGPLIMWTSSAAGDLDDDGDIDLLVSGMVRWDVTQLSPGCGAFCAGMVLPYDPIANLLLIRNEDGTYTESASTLAPALAREETTLAMMISDLDADGRVDILVGNDLGGIYFNRPLIRDDANVYQDRHLYLGLSHNARGYGMDTMGLSGADVNGDGRLDYVGTSFSDDATAVFLCEDDFCEPQPADDSGTAAAASSFRWGAALVDLDLDGRPDLVEATGHIFSDERLPGTAEQRDQLPNVMWNAGGRFEPVLPDAADGRSIGSLRGIAVTDLDEDGRPDVVFAPAVGRPVLLHNVIDSVGGWLRVSLSGRAPNTGALGARVTVWDGPERVGVQERRAGEGYLGSFDPRLFFGVVGPGPFSVEVTWPGGATTRRDGISPDQAIELTEP